MFMQLQKSKQHNQQLQKQLDQSMSMLHETMKKHQIQELQQHQQLEQSMIMSREAIQAMNKRVEETEQCIRMKELEVSIT